MIKAIYVITNKVNGKQYIGQTVHPEKRWWEHCNKANTNYDNFPIHNAIKKYGKENFTFEILEWTKDYDKREAEIIRKRNTIAPNGYNLIEGGHSPILVGECHPRNTIKNETVLNIIEDLQNNEMSDREIAKKYNTTDKIIADINHGTSHRQNNLQYPLRIKIGLQKLKQSEVLEIKKALLNTTKSYSSLAKEYNVSKGVIYHINKGLTFFDKNQTYPLRKAN